MISHLTGKILHKNGSFIVLETGGVGYKIFTPGNTLEKMLEGVTASVWTHLAVRENSHDLYGFGSLEELEFFELLITISGIGPKTALNILNIVPKDTLEHAVHSENASELVRVSGIGRKTAEKIVLELRDKLGKPKGEKGTFLKDEGDAIEALISLGYKEREAREALKKVPTETSGTSDRVKSALKILGS